MKNIYSIILLSFVVTGCSKDFLKKYDDRITDGVWRLADIDRRGYGGTINMQFEVGDQFTFSDGGHLLYINTAGTVYEGTWDIRKHWQQGSCFWDDDGRYNCDDRTARTLSLTAVDFNTQDVKSEFFNNMVFTGTNRFKAFIYSGSRTYIFRFRR